VLNEAKTLLDELSSKSGESSLLTRVLQPILIYLCHRRLRLAETQQK
jgi:hypothetical protein